MRVIDEIAALLALARLGLAAIVRAALENLWSLLRPPKPPPQPPPRRHGRLKWHD